MGILWQDLRYAMRGFLRNPTFTLTAVLAMALGIGATSAVFSVVDRVLFRSLPYRDADRLVSVGLLAPIEPAEFMLGADYVEWRQQQKPFESLTAMGGIRPCDLTDQTPIRVDCAQVESTFLRTFRVAPILGRNFVADEDRPNAPRVALLSYGFWQSRFAGSRDIIGKAISLDGRPTTIIGVLPRDFEMPNLARPEILVPLALDLAQQQRPNTGRVLRSYARLQSGVSVPQAAAALQPLFEESRKWVPAAFRNEVKFSVRPLRDRQIQDVQLASWILLGAVLAVLLIACANVANLLQARGVARRQELAIRMALGATQSRLIRQQLVECLVLALLAGAAGCVLAQGLLQVFIAIAPQGIPRIQQATLDGRILLFALGVTLLSGVLFGIATAFRRPRADALVGTRTVGLAPGLIQRLLVATQIAVSFVLLVSAGLLLRSLVNLQRTPLGLQAEKVVTANIVLGRHAYPQPAQQSQFFERLEARLKSIPGITTVALSDSVPPSGRTQMMLYAAIEVASRPRFAEGTGGSITWRSVTPGYFAALQIPILRGRSFREEDCSPAQNVTVISDSLARRLFHNEDPLGKQLRFGLAGPWYTVAGVAADVKNAGLTSGSEPEYYLVRRNSPDNAYDHSTAIIRSDFAADNVAAWVRREIAALDPTLPVTIQTMNERLGALRQRPNFNATLLGIFAAIGVSLAAIGVYGVVAFLVAERTREFGVRMALGITPAGILRFVLRRGMLPVAAGVLIGLIASLASGRLLRELLFEVSATDVATYAAVAFTLAVAALLGCYVPARRAMRVDPAFALRHE